MPGNPDISEEQPRPEIPDNRIVEQYKIYVADLGNIGTRYTPLTRTRPPKSPMMPAATEPPT
jgi:hypothetical protein